MNNTKINLEYIEQFNPCQSGIARFIKAGYANYNGNIVDFIKLDKIPFDDIKWVIFHENQKILSDNLMREFALLCSIRAVEKVSIPEITYLYDIALLQYISGEKMDSAAYNATSYAARFAARFATRFATSYAARFAARDAAIYAARSGGLDAAFSAAHFAARDAAFSVNEENIQKEILIDLIENGLVICPERN